ncbi:MAG TPA: YlxR family protein [Chloroflexia bacterium]|nr:YlxR family protein [Chloroflexia bacterium]
MAKPTKGPRPKPVPQRTCVACKTTGPKRGLVRLVRLPDGHVEVDETGKKSGRGAYLCRTRSHWEKALQSRALEYALKTAIGIDDKAALQVYAAGLPEEDSEE